VCAISAVESALTFRKAASLVRATNDRFGKLSGWLAEFNDRAESHHLG
jgi:hypothetical protein